MKKIMMALVLLMSISAVWAEYNVGDFAANDSWEDSDGGPLVSQSIQSLVDKKKVLLMTWGYYT
jgi:hypothetical protein